MRSLLNLELTVTRKRLANWVILAFVLFFLVIGYVASYFAIKEMPYGMSFLLPQHVWQFSFSQLSSNGVLLALLMGGLFFGSPFGWGTYPNRFTQENGRSTVYWSKLLTAIVILTFWLVVGLAAGHITSFSLGIVEGQMSYGFPGLWTVLRAVLLTLLIWSSWFMLSGTISLWSKKTSMGIGIGVAYYFLENVIVFAIPGFRSLVENYQYLFFGQATSAVTTKMFSLQGLSSAANLNISLGTGTIVIVCYLAAFVGLSWWRFSTMELPEH